MIANPGVIFFTDALEVTALERFVQRLEELGYDSLWIPELFGREPFATAAFALARTSRLKVATGIANVYARDAIIAAQGRQTLAELSDGRFILGLGVSHPPIAEAHRQKWVPPVAKLRGYLDLIEQTEVRSPRAAQPAPIWLAAHGPGLLRLAAARADGANTYLMPPTHTRQARERLGPDRRLNVVLPCCLCEDRDRARSVARKGLGIYLPLPAYQRQWRESGFTPADFEQGGSDRLIDALVAWGDLATIRKRMIEHRDAGASQIVISPFNPDGRGPHWKLLEALAPRP